MVYVKQFNLLTTKPMIYVANMGEEDIEDPDSNPYYITLKEYLCKRRMRCCSICAKIESELVALDAEDKAIFMDDLGIKESGLDKLIKKNICFIRLKDFLYCRT